ncbi:MAG: glucosiduronase, partial [Acidobacteriaceae bacterium]|nr:glucosiduronase [Acidobacteriaceae bacterium]
MYKSLITCPDNLLLFMHHVPYQYVLHSGKTVIQHIYDSHYDGAREAQTFPEQWKELHGLIDEGRYESVLRKLRYQAGHAIVWRDAVCNWFYRKSGIPDRQGRVGQHPDRIEGESMTLDGYTAIPITPWEDASGGKAITCSAAKCTATTRFEGKPGWYNISVEYFDENNGASQFELSVGTQMVDHWTADDTLPTGKPDAHSSTRRTRTGMALRPGDEIRVTGIPNGSEQAAIDYIEIKQAVN